MNGAVLLVDDEPGVTQSLTRLLHRRGYRTHSAHDGVAALRLMQQHDFDVVITDFNMPYMNGVEFLQKVGHKYPRIERVLMSGLSEFSMLRDAVNSARVSTFITKPWDDEDLVRVVTQSLRSAAGREDAQTFRDILDNAREGVVVIDRSGVVTDINEKLCFWLGYEAHELIGVASSTMRSDQQPREAYQALYADVVDRGCWEGELHLRRKDGGSLKTETLIKPFRDGDGCIERIVFYVFPSEFQ
ncbi:MULTISPECIES: response regulator [unclassified Hahella]|uniref:response regulator n=1 Tax=unclassified Hahella TaxID=2624107 RepID=UPI001C1EB13E|nr:MULTISPECIES: response regulator [unclassified Hahella]MBU6951267.1 response regulator [Hahella sp. HN01]MDG9670535.1 response regulator [Hahella sp. CR1]